MKRTGRTRLPGGWPLISAAILGVLLLGGPRLLGQAVPDGDAPDAQEESDDDSPDGSGKPGGPETGGVDVHEVQQAVRSGDIETAQGLVEKAAKAHPNSRDVLLCQGYMAFLRKDYAEAEKWTEKARRQSPEWFPASNNLALALCEENDAAKKRQALEYAAANVGREPDNPHAVSTHAWVLYKAGRLDDAERTIDKAIEAGDVSSDTAYYAARIAVDRGHKTMAKNLLEESLRRADFFPMRPEAEALWTALSPDSPYSFHGGDGVVVIAAKVQVRDPSDAAKVRGAVEAGKVLKIVAMKDGRLLVDAGGQTGRGWIEGGQVIKEQKAP